MSGPDQQPRVLHLLADVTDSRSESLEASEEGEESKRARLILRIRSYFGCDELEAERQVQRFAALFRGRTARTDGTGDVVMNARGQVSEGGPD